MQSTESIGRSNQSRIGRLIPVLALLAFIVPTTYAGAQEKGAEAMKILRKNDQEIVAGPPDYFTGNATIRALFSREGPSRVTGAIVSFEPGARTAWHTHPLGQTLIVTEGVGWTQVDGVIWPFSVTHQRGGRIDFRLEVSSVQLNQNLPDSMFKD